MEFKLTEKGVFSRILEHEKLIKSRESHSTLVLDNKNILIYGGFDSEGDLHSDFWIFNIEKCTSTQITNIKGTILAKAGCSIHYIDNEIYIYGG